jgi:trans-aconitate 2-methyltransferase
MTTRDWDATTYDRIGNPMARWGAAVVDRLALTGNERVLDAGCGSGRVTERLLARLPHGSVVAVDASPSMVDEARTRLAAFGDRVEYVVADLAAPLRIGTVDAILSTATFHWIPDHTALFANLAAVLRPGGQLVAQCGGGANLASVMAIIDEVDPDRKTWRPWHFATPEQTVPRLEAAGFTDVACWLNDEPTDIPPETVPDYLRTIILGSTLERMAEADREPFLAAVAARITDGHLDYVRLNIVARRAAVGAPG